MQNKFSTFLAISGLVMLTSSTLSSFAKTNECQDQQKKETSTAFIQAVNTDKYTVVQEGNNGCNFCNGSPI